MGKTKRAYSTKGNPKVKIKSKNKNYESRNKRGSKNNKY